MKNKKPENKKIKKKKIIRKIISKKEEEKSELEEEIEEESTPILSKMRNLLRLGKKAPTLEKITTPQTEMSLEQEVGFASLEEPEKEKETGRLYDDKPKYSATEDYADNTKQKQNFSDLSPRSVNSRVDLQKIGREKDQRKALGFDSGVNMQESSTEYQTFSTDKANDFKGEKSQFQEDLDRRYDFK